MKKRYEKPMIEALEFVVEERLMDVNDYSEGVGEEDTNGEYGD